MEHPTERPGAGAYPTDGTDQTSRGQGGLKEGLKASLDAPPGSTFHCAQGFLVFMTSYRKPSLLFKFLCKNV